MPQRPKSLKSKAKLPVAPKSPKNQSSKVRDLEERLAEALKREAEAQQRETATADILRVISNSLTDVQPVLDAVAESAARLCESSDAEIFRRDGARLLLVAHHGPIPSRTLVVPLVRETFNGRTVLDGRTLHVVDLQSETDEFPRGSEIARQHGTRAQLSVPLMREGVAIGTISLRRAEARLFTERQVALLQIFADQAVIAIENVRLFTELEARNRDLTDALDQQTATSEILRAITHVPTDTQPVFDTIVRSAATLCHAVVTAVFLTDGQMVFLPANYGSSPEALGAVRARFPRPLDMESSGGIAILTRSVVHVPDSEEPSVSEEMRHNGRRLGFRSLITVPMLRESEAVGAIGVYRREPGRFSDAEVALLQTFADQAVIAIENVRLFTELQEKNQALTMAHAQVSESLEQQTATSEILRVISQSPTDLQPVFDTIVASAARLCQAAFATLHRFDGQALTFEAQHGMREAALEQARQNFPQPAGRHRAAGRAVLDRHVAHIHDIRKDQEYLVRSYQEDYRTVLAVPLIRKGVPVGAFALWRREVQPFSGQQIELVKTFADQAVIAIENVRLFTELQEKNRALTEAHTQVSEALDQQTATSEILRVISSSLTDVQPVFDAIVTSAVRLCDARFANVFRLDGEIVHLVAHHNLPLEALEQFRRTFPQPLSQGGTITAQAMRRRAVVHVHDIELLSDVPVAVRELSRSAGYRSAMAVPILRKGSALGAIGVGRSDGTGAPRPFSDKEVALLTTFADQAVIAIENVRLFTELQEKNQALTEAHAQVTEALEQQTATSGILRIISSSLTDLTPVAQAIADSAGRLCGCAFSAVFRFDGELIQWVAARGTSGEQEEALRVAWPRPPGNDTLVGRTILAGETLHFHDAASDASYMVPAVRPGDSAVRTALAIRSWLGVPMLREGQPIGVIALSRSEVRPFSEREIALVTTFADQAVIAIENVRLFTELQASNRELTAALDKQTATGDILRVISQSPTDVQPVFDTIVESARRLLRGYSAALTRVDGDQLVLCAFTGTDDAGDAAVRTSFPRPIDEAGAQTQVIRDRGPVNIADTHTDLRLPGSRRVIARARGYRSMLAVPLLRQGEAIGGITVTRREPGGFTDDEIALLQTFADQAVIAIENVRLFTELQEKNQALTQAHAQVSEALEQQTATSEILRVISSSPTDVQPVFDTIVSSAVRLCAGLFGALYRFDGELLHLVAHYNYTPEALEAAHRVFPGRPSRGGGPGRAILDRAVAHIPDIQLDLEHRYPAVARAVGWRSGLFVPMLREGVPIGVIAVTRAEPRPFSNSEIELLKTFADQAVIAIENVRLFTELQASNRELTTALDKQTATGDILRVISRSQTDVQPVFDAIVASAVRLLRAYSGAVTRIAGDQIELVALTSTDAAGDAALRALFPQLLQSEVAHAQAIRDRAPFNIVDAHTDPRVPEAQHADARARGYRSLVVVPLIRHDEAIGALAVSRREPGGFTDDEIALLQTFADQAVIAIENVRLLNELQARTQDLTRSVGQLTALGEVGRAVSSTLDLETVLSTIVSRAIQLSGTDGGSVYEYDEATEEFSLRASRDLPEAYVEQVRDAHPRKGEGAVGRVAQTREPVQIADISDAATYESRVRNMLLQIGLRALLAVPLIVEDQLVGALIVMRKRSGTFAAEEVTLLQTFATQSALAIQNARLFREIEDKSRQLEVASQHKSEFLANMSHELRTPLNAIIGFSEVLTDRMFGELNEKQDEYLKDIYASGTHLLSLINDILDLSKIEAGRMELELTDFHLPTALDNALTLVRERATRRGIALHTNVDERLGQIQADERKIRQVVLNLLSNAIKFTPEGGRIEVAALPKDGSVEVSVSDTGVGIAPEDQEAVFEEFRQVGMADKKAEGTGLGLTLCRKFIELHGGRIWVASQVGVGSTFTFTIPVRHGE